MCKIQQCEDAATKSSVPINPGGTKVVERLCT